MSLNGLDDLKVQEAHGAAAAEPGGWFLLKYASRDEIELLGRGSGGIVEVRTKIAEYEETSPLYGFLRYRRRNVLIKYLPEDCSRLIQARVAVHFNAVCERFSPYDTTFEITTAKELKDTKLSAACSLHAASGSNSSATSSIRRRRLVEIAEEEEEEQQQRASKRQSLNQDGDEVGPPQTPQPDNGPADPVTLNSELASSPEERKFSASSTSEVPNFVGVGETPGSEDLSGEGAPRMSSQSGRPDYSNYNPYSYGKPKVKLAPRPSLETGGRPRTAGSFRPVSQMPAGFKLFGKGSKKGKKDDGATSTEEELAENGVAANALSIPEEDNLAQPEDVARPTTSSGVSTAPSVVPAPPAKSVISPEKARLMKAMKLREKKKKKNLTINPLDAPGPEIDSPALSIDTLGDKSVEDEELETQPSITNEDSAIGLDASSSSMNTDQASELTQSDSHPASPIIASSEPDHSTKASSLSESTDETVQAKSDDMPDDEDELDISKPVEEPEKESTPEAVGAPAADTTIEQTVTKESIPAEAVETPTSAEPKAAPQTDTQSKKDGPEEKPEGILPAPIGETDSIPATSTFAFLSSKGPETDQIPDATETKEGEDANTITLNNGEDLSPKATPALQIPKSKFSSQNLHSEAQSPSVPTINSPDERSILEESPAITADKANDEDANADTTTESKPKRKFFVEPIRTDLTRPESQIGVHLSDDELDELQSATFQDARPMLVSKSPVTPVFPSPTKGGPSPHTVRTVSNPVRGTFLTPGDVSQSSARSVSSGGAALLHKVAQQPVGPNLSKRSNVGSSISQRIKALEKLSATSGKEVAPPRGVSRERPSSTFFSVKKGREASRSPSLADRTNSFTRPAVRTPPSRSGSRDESPEATRRPRRDRSASVASRLSMFEAPSEGNSTSHSPGSTPRGRPESISVTAKIVRDPNAARSFEPPKDLSEFNHLELKQSPLMVDHHKAAPGWTPTTLEQKDTIQERRMSKESRASQDTKSRRSSLTVVKDFIKERRKSVTSITSDAFSGSRSPTRPPSTHQNSTSFTQRLSISSRRSSFNRDRESVLSPTPTEGSGSGDDSKSNSDKKKSRAGRFMRRLSSLSGSRGKIAMPPGISATVAEEDLEPIRPATTGSPSIASYMGDVNVQFPDNLLWKRRNLCLDTQGYLIFSALPGQSGRAAQGTKRYHMSEFRQPYIPDVDAQELPNSVVLDFMEGSGLQVACEDRSGQTTVLQTVQDAHRKYATSFGQ
ncbi:hypothetical protein BGZ61DRAFT_114530 [Ilyonectria robusta]|uniref:uncharacterized protein n=1 Tax=Ilyonectria robusta TaxID=1079257 RepID=UPI001E8E0D62|nr:uncharacterized protein BGZ61DRAFT_114530 [Ilyonectria robusta]KAH8670054.1 hypothetical protein BGZ61DRAFT_114530 [Ilyonectria robusta]